MRSVSLVFALVSALGVQSKKNILLGNDDGWAIANVRAFYDALTGAGHNVVLSAPASGKSGSGSLDLPAVPVLFGCQFDSCPALSPAQGSDKNNARLNYVNSFPVTAIKYGLSDLAPKFFNNTGGKPELVVTGPNVGDNLGIINDEFSGTLGAAAAAARAGIPAIGFSGKSGEMVSYTTRPTGYSETYAAWAASFVARVLKTNASPLVPAGIILNVNFPETAKCAGSTAPQFILTRQIGATIFSGKDFVTCGNAGRLPKEEDVVDSGCYASVTALDMKTKLDVSDALQGSVAKILGDFLSCHP